MEHEGSTGLGGRKYQEIFCYLGGDRIMVHVAQRAGGVTILQKPHGHHPGQPATGALIVREVGRDDLQRFLTTSTTILRFCDRPFILVDF